MLVPTIVLALISQTLAQPAPTEPPAAQPPRAEAPRVTTPQTRPLSLELDSSYTFGTDLQDGPGGYSVSSLSASASYSTSVGSRSMLGLTLGAGIRSFDFDDGSSTLVGFDPNGGPGGGGPVKAIARLGAGLGGGGGTLTAQTEPWDDLYSATATATLAIQFNSTWAGVGGLIGRVSGESGVSFSDAFTGGGFIGARHKLSPILSLTLGVIALSQLEDSARILPLLGIDWKIDDKWSLTSQGLGLKLNNKISDQWTLFLQAEYESWDYRLDDDGPNPEGVVRDRRAPISIGAQYAISDRFSLTGQLGIVAWQEFTVENDQGLEVSEISSDPSPFIFVGGQIQF